MDFADVLADISDDIVNVSNSFALEHAPLLTEPITVKIK